MVSKRCKVWKCSKCSYIAIRSENVWKHIRRCHDNNGAPEASNAVIQTDDKDDPVITDLDRERPPYTINDLSDDKRPYYISTLYRYTKHSTCLSLSLRVDDILRSALTMEGLLNRLVDVESFEDILVTIFKTTSMEAPNGSDIIWRFGASKIYGLLSPLNMCKITSEDDAKRYLFETFSPKAFDLMFNRMSDSADVNLKRVCDTWEAIVMHESTDDLMSKVSRDDLWGRLLPCIRVIEVDFEVYHNIYSRVTSM
jgi:hypothetical protein